MIYLLDTNACISYLNHVDSPVRDRLEKCRPDQVVLCSVVEAELHFGVQKSGRPCQNLEKLKIFLKPFISLPFDSCAAFEFGWIRSRLHRQGKPIGPYDLQIAAIALTNGLILITHNVAEFSRVDGLQIEDWEAG